MLTLLLHVCIHTSIWNARDGVSARASCSFLSVNPNISANPYSFHEFEAECKFAFYAQLAFAENPGLYFKVLGSVFCPTTLFISFISAHI